jgi:hypothetical protein
MYISRLTQDLELMFRVSIMIKNDQDYKKKKAYEILPESVAMPH